MNRCIPSFLLLCSLALLAFGCSGNEKKNQLSAGPNAGDIREEVIRKISVRVLSDIPNKGLLKKIRERGVLKVSLPYTQPPFQFHDPLNLPAGFNPALANEIAKILQVKPNITILDATTKTDSKSKTEKPEFDLFFIDSGLKCPAGDEIKYYYNGSPDSWKRICVAGGDRYMTEAVREILTYLNETGIYAQLYANHVRK